MNKTLAALLFGTYTSLGYGGDLPLFPKEYVLGEKDKVEVTKKEDVGPTRWLDAHKGSIPLSYVFISGPEEVACDMLGIGEKEKQLTVIDEGANGSIDLFFYKDIQFTRIGELWECSQKGVPSAEVALFATQVQQVFDNYKKILGLEKHKSFNKSNELNTNE